MISPREEERANKMADTLMPQLTYTNFAVDSGKITRNKSSFRLNIKTIFDQYWLFIQAERSEARVESVLVKNCRNIQPKTRLVAGNFSRVF